MKINFTKMHGIGNDYIYVNCLQNMIADPEGLAIAMSKRHFSVGADGVVLICKSQIADAKMRMFNADGSEGKMCGNAIRCVGKYLFDNDICKKQAISIETLSGIKYIELKIQDGIAVGATVNMGIASLAPACLPVLSPVPLINSPLTVNGITYNATAVSVGNPHCIVYVDDVDNFDVEGVGSCFERLDIFPERVNTEFVQVIDKNTLKMRVWERGSGETYACGTGASATAVASIINGYCSYDTPITIRLIGGDLQIRVASDLTVYMSGSATKVYEGVYEYEN